MSILINGQLEIDAERGVIYFHAIEGELAGASVLRISQLPAPIPIDRQLDITHMHGADWKGCTQDHQVSPNDAPHWLAIIQGAYLADKSQDGVDAVRLIGEVASDFVRKQNRIKELELKLKGEDHRYGSLTPRKR